MAGEHSSGCSFHTGLSCCIDCLCGLLWVILSALNRWIPLSAGMGRALTGAGQPGGAARPGERQKRSRDFGLDDEYESDFVDTDDDGGGDWRSALRSVTKYDPRK